MTDDGLPADPMSPVLQDGIHWHEVMSAFAEAGFTDEQAFELTRLQVEAFATAAYMHAFEEHGCQRPGCYASG